MARYYIIILYVLIKCTYALLFQRRYEPLENIIISSAEQNNVTLLMYADVLLTYLGQGPMSSASSRVVTWPRCLERLLEKARQTDSDTTFTRKHIIILLINGLIVENKRGRHCSKEIASNSGRS